jgi:hypothetical protein
MTRVFTKAVSRWSDELNRYVLIEAESDFTDSYDGDFEQCKGDDTAKKSEQLSLQNQQQQMAFSAHLQSIFDAQYKDQKQILDYIKGKLMPQIDNPQGYSDASLAAQRTGASDTISSNYQHAQQALNTQRFAMGGRDIPSGIDDQLTASLDNSEAQDKAGAQNQITQNNEDLKQRNYWNALGVLQGTGAQFAPQSYAAEATGAGNGASGAGNSVANLSQAYKASQGGFWSSFTNSLGSTLGKTLGGGNAGAGGGTGVGGFFGLG